MLLLVTNIVWKIDKGGFICSIVGVGVGFAMGYAIFFKSTTPISHPEIINVVIRIEYYFGRWEGCYGTNIEPIIAYINGTGDRKSVV